MMEAFIEKKSEHFSVSEESFHIIAKSTKILKVLSRQTLQAAFFSASLFGKSSVCEAVEVIKILSKILKYVDIQGNIGRRQNDEQFEMIIQLNELLFERINLSFDESLGVPKQAPLIQEARKQLPEHTSASWNLGNFRNSLKKKSVTEYAKHRPQMLFKESIDNSENPFKPKINHKYNSNRPLSYVPYYNKDEIIGFMHPYEMELLEFQIPVHQLQSTIPVKPNDIKSTPFFFINSTRKLMKAYNELKKEKQIAIDLEHHSYRSYLGITCLIQISTRYNDYIIDALILRDELQILNEIFTNPQILKIFHGADFDIEWLQRDFGIYVVNMFDTHQAAKIIGLNRLSLKFLLKHYCNIDADKTFQLADWRIRPLPYELINYARQDTHYLIYIASLQRNEILKKPCGICTLKVVYNISRDICRKIFAKPKINDDSLMEMFRKSKRSFDNRQLVALKEIYLWRDKVARLEDESCGYILPNHMLLQIAETLPRELQGILACCNPIPSSVRQNLNLLHKIILKAREQPLVKTFNDCSMKTRNKSWNKEFSSKLNMFYDISIEAEFKDNILIPALETPKFYLKPILNVFEFRSRFMGDDKCFERRKSGTAKFVSPYERFNGAITNKCFSELDYNND